MVLGMAEMSQCAAGRCSVQPEPVCIPSSRNEPGKAVGEGIDPNPNRPPGPSPRASQTRRFGSEEQSQEQGSDGEGERAGLADERHAGRSG